MVEFLKNRCLSTCILLQISLCVFMLNRPALDQLLELFFVGLLQGTKLQTWLKSNHWGVRIQLNEVAHGIQQPFGAHQTTIFLQQALNGPSLEYVAAGHSLFWISIVADHFYVPELGSILPLSLFRQSGDVMGKAVEWLPAFLISFFYEAFNSFSFVSPTFQCYLTTDFDSFGEDEVIVRLVEVIILWRFASASSDESCRC